MEMSRVRKQVYELLPSDLDEWSAWEFALDEEEEEDQDEATVRPYVTDGPVDPTAGMFIVRAKFTLADGTTMEGYLTPPIEEDKDELGIIQPVIVTDSGQVGVWLGGMKPTDEAIAGYYTILGKTSPMQVFPLHFESNVPLETGSVNGEVPGFLVLEDFASGRTRVVK